MLFTEVLEADITFYHMNIPYLRPALSQHQARVSFFESFPYETGSSILAINL
jgi:hypothetical protein